jgi:hypothetical protein
VNESCIESTEPFDADVVAVAHNACLLAFHVAAGLQCARRLVGAGPGERGIARLLGVHAHGEQPDEDDRHRGKERPALPRVADHATECVAQSPTNQQNREHLEEVRQRCRILERMRGIDVEESAAVRAELLDRDLRRRRSDGDHLLLLRRLLGDWIAFLVLDRLARSVELRIVVLDRFHQWDRRV